MTYSRLRLLYTPRHILNPKNKLRIIKRLRHIIISTKLQAQQLIIHLTLFVNISTGISLSLWNKRSNSYPSVSGSITSKINTSGPSFHRSKAFSHQPLPILHNLPSQLHPNQITNTRFIINHKYFIILLLPPHIIVQFSIAKIYKREGIVEHILSTIPSLIQVIAYILSCSIQPIK